MTTTIALILRTLAQAFALNLFGKASDKIAPVLNTIASLAELPDSTADQRQAVLDMVNVWVAEKRAPNAAELGQLKQMRNDLNAQIETALEHAQAELDAEKGAADPAPSTEKVSADTSGGTDAKP